MKAKKIKNVFKLFAILLPVWMTSCGGSKTNAVTQNRAGAVPNRAGDRELMSAVDLQSRAAEGQVAGSCLNILMMSGQDVFTHNESVHSVEAAVYELSKLSAQDLRDTHMAYVQQASGKTISGGYTQRDLTNLAALGSIDDSYGGFLSGGTSASSSTFNFDDSHKKLIDFLAVHQQSASDFSHDIQVMKSVMSEQGLASYAKCVTARGAGLTCELSEKDDMVSFHVTWAPHDLVREKLPRLALRLAANENLIMVRDKFPETIGIGTGDVVAFRKIKNTKTALIQVTASDASGEFSFQCSNFSR